jgi:RNAse (barnase) inhibitor barstar
MNSDDASYPLADATQSGVFLVPAEDFAGIARSAEALGLTVQRIDLAGATDKQSLLGSLSRGLRFPPDLGRNWDALSDSLRDLGWLPAKGYVVLLEHTDELQRKADDDYQTALDILDEAAISWADQDVPFWVFAASP